MRVDWRVLPPTVASVMALAWYFLGNGFVQPLLKQRQWLALASCSSSWARS
jgi:hypothetical protein